MTLRLRECVIVVVALAVLFGSVLAGGALADRIPPAGFVIVIVCGCGLGLLALSRSEGR